MAKYGFVFDIERCNGCFSCFLACKDEFTDNDHLPTASATCAGVNLMYVNEVEYGTGSKVKVDYIPVPCQHCEDAPCISRYPDQVYRRDDGIVIIDPEKSKGNKDLLKACPYGAIKWNETSSLPQKCTMCAHLLDAGEKVTRCSECCPNGALIFGDTEDPNSEISLYMKKHADELEKFRPQYDTKPNVSYRRLPKPFICGEVVCGDNGACCKGAKVTAVCGESGKIMETVTDFFGDFEFRFLPLNTPFTIRAEAEGYQSAEVNTRTNASVNLGEIVLIKA